MSTALQSPGGVFVQSPGGVRSAAGLLVVQQTIWIMEFKSFGVALPTQLCPDGSPFNTSGFYFYYDLGFQARGYYGPITNITQSNPAVVTVGENHDFTNLMKVAISQQVGMPELPIGPHDINVLSDTTFELVDIDSTNYTPYTSGGLAHPLNVTDPALQGNFLGLTSAVEFEWYLNCKPATYAALIYDSLGVPAYTGAVVFESIGEAWRLHYGPVAVGGEEPQFVNGEKLLVSIYSG